MDAAALMLPLYLLFPVLSPGQAGLERAAGKPSYAPAEREQLRADMLLLLADGFADDDGEGLLLTDALENPAYGPQSEGSALAQGMEGGVAEVIWRNAQGRLQAFSYGEEQLAVGTAPGGQRVVVSANDAVLFRTEYDGEWRVTERTVWRNAEASSGVSLLSRKRYGYAGTARTPLSCTEEFIPEGRLRETRYGAGGLVELVRESVTADGATVPVKELRYAYDGDGRVVSEETRMLDGSVPAVKKSVYAYTVVAEVPDLRYYEDGQLRVQVEYDGADSYVQTVWFDGGLSVATRFEDGRRVREDFRRLDDGGQ